MATRCFFDRALRTVKEYNGKIEYLHLNPVRFGLVVAATLACVSRAQDWAWSSVREYSGSLQEEATRHPILPIDCVLLPSEERKRI